MRWEGNKARLGFQGLRLKGRARYLGTWECLKEKCNKAQIKKVEEERQGSEKRVKLHPCQLKLIRVCLEFGMEKEEEASLFNLYTCVIITYSYVWATYLE